MEEEEGSFEQPPKLIFIVPYRDREQQYLFFRKHMAEVMSNYAPKEYVLWYIHQCDTRPFNRGALKNIGVLLAQQKYPNDWEKITLVFNDIDTMPFTSGYLNYETTRGVVKHFYGFRFALGGIVSINAGDAYSIDGFPNYWAWGFEDNALNHRVIKQGLRIDRTQFHPILDKNIMYFHDGEVRQTNRIEFDRYVEKGKDGIQNISGLEYTERIREGDTNGIFMEVSAFAATTAPPTSQFETYDLSAGKRPFELTPAQMKKLGIPPHQTHSNSVAVFSNSTMFSRTTRATPPITTAHNVMSNTTTTTMNVPPMLPHKFRMFI